MNLVNILLTSEKIKLKRKRIVTSKETTVAQLIYKLRRVVPELKPHEAIFIFFKINDVLVLEPSNKTMGEIRKESDEKYLFVEILRESTFG